MSQIDLKKKTEVVIMGSILALTVMAPLNANAGKVGFTAVPTARTAYFPVGDYVLEEFTLNVSANVAMNFNHDQTGAAVTAASNKGMHTFGGTTHGGSVKQCESSSLANPVPGIPDLTNGCPTP
ncbi:hypothetical protein ACUHMQ_12605 [Chitinimonas sp. PSY-7]|uniref:hypothetical protein n=1 Tax=Chitinimonas sp. PSY-7 TaxID=3459088 RepID=UPI00403FCC1D